MPRMALLLIVLMFGSVCIAQAPQMAKVTPSNDAAQLKELEHKWMNAEVHGDASYLDAILAPDYTYTSPSAQMMTKAELVDSIKTGKIKAESGTVSDLNVRIYGDAAVVTGTYTEKGSEAGKPFSDSGRFTDTFIKKNGKWMAVATHSSNKTTAGAAAQPAAKKETN